VCKHYVTCGELWGDGVYEMIVVEVKDRDPKIAWEIVSIYRYPKEEVWIFLKNYQTEPDIWEEIFSVASLVVIAT